MKWQIALIALVFAMVSTPQQGQETGERRGDHDHERAFRVYDNMFYRGKPDMTKDGLVVANILYENKIWPGGRHVGELPERDDFIKLVHQNISNPGPLVIDIESLPFSGNELKALTRLSVLKTLADWAHAAAPGKVIGFYGTHTLTKVDPSYLPFARELAQHVDAFFPPAYVFDDDREGWRKGAEAEVEEAHQLGPGKPVYFYLWPQYHDNTPKQFQYVSADYWKFQLETTYRLADAAVLWSPSKLSWDNHTGWWTATQEFMHAIHKGGRQ
jgi:hypothetical protein